MNLLPVKVSSLRTSLEHVLQGAGAKPVRVIALSVPVGKPVDIVVNSLLDAGLEKDDIKYLDTGNSLLDRYRGAWSESQANCASLAPLFLVVKKAQCVGPLRLHERALTSISWRVAWTDGKRLSVKVDANGLPVGQFEAGEACAAYVGPSGTGHYVKWYTMVLNMPTCSSSVKCTISCVMCLICQLKRLAKSLINGTTVYQ